MPKKLEYEDVVKIFKEKGLYLLDEKYINSKTKMKCKDSNNYFYEISVGDIKDSRTKWFDIVSNKNPYTIKNIQNFIIINNGNAKLLSKVFISNREKLEFVCECGKKYKICWGHLKNCKKFSCNDCSLKKRTNEIRMNHIELNKILYEYGYKLIDFNYNSLHKIEIIDEYGYKYSTSIYNIKNKNMDITKNKFGKQNPYTINNINNYMLLNNIPCKLKDSTEREVEIKKDKLEFICCECKDTFYATFDQVRNENKYRCEKCSKVKSNLEWIVEEYLKIKNVKYTPQKRFEDCRNKNPLPFDFYLDNYNTIIEVNGSQHYYENELFSQSLQERQRIDNIKKDYCNKNKINFIEIPFWKIFNNEEKYTYKKIIDNILNQE